MDPLVTAEELRVALARPTLAGDLADLAVTTSSGLIRDFCGWSVSMEETTFTVDGSGTTILNLPTLLLVDVNEVRIDGVILAVGEYRWSAQGQLEREAGWPKRFRCVQVDVLHGHDEIPDGVRAVGLALAGRVIANPDGASSWTRTVGGVSRSVTHDTMAGNLSALQLAQISRYRLP